MPTHFESLYSANSSHIVPLQGPEDTTKASQFRGIDPTTPCVARPFALRRADERNSDKLTAGLLTSAQQQPSPT